MRERILGFIEWYFKTSEEYAVPASIFFCFIILFSHFVVGQSTSNKAAHVRNEIVFAGVFGAVAFVICINLLITPQAVSHARLMSVLAIYGVTLFVVLSVAMKVSLAFWLTKRRGEKWLKELDYLYLSLGGIGIVTSVSRLPFVTDRIAVGDLIAPLMLTTAVVIRFLKTRGDIAGWNKIATIPAPAASNPGG